MSAKKSKGFKKEAGTGKMKSIKGEKPEIEYRFYNPIDTKYILYSEIFKKGSDFEKNINLLFSRLIPEISSERSENKGKHLDFVIKEFDNFKNKLQIFSLLSSRRESFIKSLEDVGFISRGFSALCQWRLIIGLGGVHPEETSMTLHHIYGIPYIPGSAVKGVTRHWAVLKFADRSGQDVNRISNALENGENLDIEVEGIKFSDLIEIFGTQGKVGRVIFMDAYPLREDAINLKIDIMNPHYPDYYSGKQPPADWQNPNPIKFLTVEKTHFQFYLISQDSSLLQKSEVLLKEALGKFGIGAKTSLGYGIFEI
ncbi:CRISPR-associated protein Cmr6 [Candidatus Kryptonium thompsonii]|jgi:CRISPR-associated protein Cmr6|uniref:CRISPR-associated protein Cmr6 n=1 Tax=Candidatus Kryptonium thompsonii TaxID=1633631 RepID=A0ABP2B3K6_9BACT|nr:type III-B CRISPR module RAMP protein Cmr6 [Candidatus Kryptonium thompsoni]CUS76847.1 CRISPR-associated protein Cmr6 [Candidatus Kryptonium thompsoni]CUS85962.1 CRISPR-associated protein Cmr6 [Candidatus Kryptonium thompsoni]CUS92568.1 CRISPR-associated protein Cmr6 [Candidatus Kryptonium thompsoni]CUS92751.1 CRISPR-associated protein Cmr6 [Candidatus Kryptonium thompsoni]CUS94177.1 CRISPR-associated protein Cmr6 [Candidatus Kryptonium thompsoni]